MYPAHVSAYPNAQTGNILVVLRRLEQWLPDKGADGNVRKWALPGGTLRRAPHPLGVVLWARSSELVVPSSMLGASERLTLISLPSCEDLGAQDGGYARITFICFVE